MSQAELDAAYSSQPEFGNNGAATRAGSTVTATASESHRGDRFDLQQEIGIGEPA
jgi:hypothetical protein